MLATLLVPLDGSPLAERALPPAEELARRARARLVLLQAVEGESSDARAGAESYLRGIAGDLEARGLPVDLSTPRGDDVAALIADEAEARNAGLIVMVTHGRDGLARFFSDSIAEEVLRQTTRPIMLIRGDDDLPATAPLPEHPRIMVTLDGTPFAESALPLAHELAQRTGGDLILQGVVTPPPPPAASGIGMEGPLAYDDIDLEAARDDSQAYLRDLGQRHGLDFAAVRASIAAGDAAGGIAAAVEEVGASLVVMATHARSGLGRLFFGDTATDTLREIAVPLVLLRVDDGPELAGSEQAHEVAQPNPLSASALNIA